MPITERMRTRLLALALLIAGCAAPSSIPMLDGPAIDEPVPTTTSTTTSIAAAVTATTQAASEEETAEETAPTGHLVLRAGTDVGVYHSPSDSEPYRTLPATTILDTPTVLLVVSAPEGDWAEVILPGRPNGDRGWVRTEGMEEYRVPGMIRVDLSQRVLTYLEDGVEVLRTEVAVGSPRNPTPTGLFYVTDSVPLDDPLSPWGPHALGLSARSETITEYNGGDGIIGIHGTNRPGSIGEAASLGCVRLPNEAMLTLAAIVPIGTPVEITG